MKSYPQVDAYMQEIGLKYVKNSNEFIAGLAMRTDKNYTKRVAEELNSRAQHSSSGNMVFYKMKNESLDASIYISAAFDGGLFRHLGNLIIDNPQLFENKQVLELACDCGITACFIAKMFPSCRIVGVDVNSSAVENAAALAKRLGLDNAEFVCCDVFEYQAAKKADTVCTFRALLDVCMAQTKELPFFGERSWREEQYRQAFGKLVGIIKENAAENADVLSVERYTADYGWLGYMLSLEEHGFAPVGEKCALMRASDISSVKEYSVTYAASLGDGSAEAAFNAVMSREFKSGQGYEGEMAEFAFYYDSVGDKNFYDIYKDGKILHQFATAQTEAGKLMYYEASGNKKKIKYFNAKKQENLEKQLNNNLDLYSEITYKIEKYVL